MTEATHTNGRPTWRDIMEQVGASESRIQFSIQQTEKALTAKMDALSEDVTQNRTEVKDLVTKVDTLSRAQLIREKRISDIRYVTTGARGFLLVVCAVGGLVLGILNIAGPPAAKLLNEGAVPVEVVDPDD